MTYPDQLSPQGDQGLYTDLGTVDSYQATPAMQDFLGSYAPPLPAEPSSPGDLRAYAAQAAQDRGLDPAIFTRMINQESGFNPEVQDSPAGARGIAQLMPLHWSKVDPTDPVASLDYAAGLLSSHYQQYGDYPSALAAYNGGGRAVDLLQAGTPYGETSSYLSSILGPDWESGDLGDRWWKDQVPASDADDPYGLRAALDALAGGSRRARIPSANDALNDAAIRFGGISYDAMSTAQRNQFKAVYELLDMMAVSRFQQPYRLLSKDQRAAVAGDFSATGTEPAELAATIGSASAAYAKGRMTRDSFLTILTSAGISPHIAQRFLDRQQSGVDTQLINVTTAAAQAQFRAGSLDSVAFKRALTDAGVGPEVADQVVNREVAMKALQDFNQNAILQRQQTHEMNRAFIAQPKPLEGPPRTATTHAPLTWSRASLLIPSDDLQNLTDAWASGSDGVTAISPERWRYLAAALPNSPAVPVLARQLRALWLSTSGRQPVTSRPTPVFRPLSSPYPFTRRPSFGRLRGSPSEPLFPLPPEGFAP